MNIDEKFNLIKRNTQEIVDEAELKDLLKNKKTPSAYIGYAPTGLLHIGHLAPLVKIADFLSAGFKFTFLSADLHAFLDDKKTPWEKLNSRAKVYTELVKASLKSIGVSPKNVKFVQGTDFQLKKSYVLDTLHLLGEVTLNRAKRAAAEVVRFGDSPKVGGFVYPMMEIIDVKALGCDVAFGGIDQRGIYMLGREIMHEINYPKPVCVFGPLVSGLAGGRAGGKMSASREESKISLLATESEIKEKLAKAFCPEKEVDGNPVLEMLKLAIFPIFEGKNKEFAIKRPEKFGGNVSFKTYADLEQAFEAGKIHPMDLKNGTAVALNEVLAPIRKHFENPKLAKLLKEAYG